MRVCASISESICEYKFLGITPGKCSGVSGNGTSEDDLLVRLPHDACDIGFLWASGEWRLYR